MHDYCLHCRRVACSKLFVISYHSCVLSSADIHVVSY